MSINKLALIRYKAIDECLRNRYRKWTLEDLIEKGRDLERIVLSRAVRWRLAHRILSYGSKTVVFD